MANTITNYKCPSCGSSLHFDSDLQKLKCDYCGSVFDVSQFENKLNEDGPAAAIEDSREEMMMRSYTCPSCGAEIICDETTVATSCPYCDNAAIIAGELKGTKRPDYVIPFQMKKEEAVESLKSFYRGKPLLPKSFKEENHIEDIKGMYVPFWLYDGKADFDMMYKTTRVRTHTRGDDMITETSHFDVFRSGTVEFHKIPADASINMPDDFMDAIEPFDYSQLTKFNTGYLPGYIANKYDVSSTENLNRIYNRMENSAKDVASSSVIGYASCFPVKEDVTADSTNVKYTFFPVWMLATRYREKVYLFVMNAQTGKMVSDDLPIDIPKALLIFFVLFFVLLVIITIVFAFMSEGGIYL